MSKPATAEEQEALFQAIIRKIPSVDTPARLQEVATLALALMLRRPADHELKAELTRKIKEIVGGVRSDHPPDSLRAAARGCIQVLQLAKARRLPRSAQQGTAGNWAKAGGKPRRPTRSEPEKEAGRKAPMVLAVAAVLITVIGGYVWWRGARSDEGESSTDIARFIEQVIQAGQGSAEPTHVFGGALRLQSLGGRPVVVAEGVPPRVCAAAGWGLVRKGILTINGITPNRVSATRITELCNSEDGNAVIMWMPK